MQGGRGSRPAPVVPHGVGDGDVGNEVEDTKRNESDHETETENNYKLFSECHQSNGLFIRIASAAYEI